MYRSFTSLIFVLVLAFSLACGQSEESAPDTSATDGTTAQPEPEGPFEASIEMATDALAFEVVDWQERKTWSRELDRNYGPFEGSNRGTIISFYSPMGHLQFPSENGVDVVSYDGDLLASIPFAHFPQLEAREEGKKFWDDYRVGQFADTWMIINEGTLVDDQGTRFDVFETSAQLVPSSYGAYFNRQLRSDDFMEIIGEEIGGINTQGEIIWKYEIDGDGFASVGGPMKLPPTVVRGFMSLAFIPYQSLFEPEYVDVFSHGQGSFKRLDLETGNIRVEAEFGADGHFDVNLGTPGLWFSPVDAAGERSVTLFNRDSGEPIWTSDSVANLDDRLKLTENTLFVQRNDSRDEFWRFDLRSGDSLGEYTHLSEEEIPEETVSQLEGELDSVRTRFGKAGLVQMIRVRKPDQVYGSVLDPKTLAETASFQTESRDHVALTDPGVVVLNRESVDLLPWGEADFTQSIPLPIDTSLPIQIEFEPVFGHPEWVSLAWLDRAAPKVWVLDIVNEQVLAQVALPSNRVAEGIELRGLEGLGIYAIGTKVFVIGRSPYPQAS